MKEKVLTIYEVRLYIRGIAEALEKVNAHVCDNSLCQEDFNRLRRAWEDSRDVMASKWTNDLF